MPRRKGHGIPPTKRVKQLDAISRSAPLKNKLYNEIPVVSAKEESLQMTVNSAPIKSEPPSIISDVLHSKYLHKKFKKMASTLLSEDHHNHINSALNGSRLKSVSRNSLSPASSDNERASPRMSSPRPNTDNPVNSPPAGRYVCSYCKLACSKPSVLQKHIRAHTNERPYPCLPCGFAFKTKSNLYKHCRSRSHASKLEETGEKMPTFDGEEGVSSEDDSLSNVSTAASLTSRTELDLENRDEIPKSIYKPKYRFMEHTNDLDMREKTEERKENANSPPHLQLMIPVPNLTQSVSTPSPFTSGSSPSPEFLHRHINKLISENQAIVETNDPFWSKKCLQKTSSNDYFPVSTPTTSAPMEALLRKTVKTPNVIDSSEELSCDKQAPKHSKLALALLRPHPPISPKFLNELSTEICDAQPLNLTTNNKELNSTQPNRKRSYSEGIPERSPKIKDRINNILPKLHNNSLQDFKRFASTLSENNASVLLNHLDIKKDLLGNAQNPEGSIIKDLLLKARAANSAINTSLLDSLANSKPLASLTPPVSDDRAYSPSSQFMCHLCRDSVSYKTAENLEIHQVYHCKGSDASSRLSLNSPSPRSVSPSFSKFQNRETSIVTIPSHPSPGPLLGSTPLVDSYQTNPKDSNPLMLKRRKYDNGSIESRSTPAATSRSLEEIPKSMMRSNVQMFGGEVKILDHGETKTLRIEPSNRGNSKSAHLSVSSSSVKQVMKKDNHTHESDSNMVVTIAKQSLHTGGSIIQVPQKCSVGEITTRLVSSSENTMSFSSVQTLSGYQDSNKLIYPLMSNTVTTSITLAGVSSSSIHRPFQFPSMLSETAPVINPLTNITAFNPLTLPPAAGSQSPGIPSMYSPGIVTILHGGKEIPFVPGMPGPHSTHPGPNFSSKLELDKRFSLFSENKSNTSQEPVVKSPRHEKPSHVVTPSLSIPSLQLNSEKMKNVGESPPRKRSLDETVSSTVNAKSTNIKRTQGFTLLSEPKEAESGATEKKFLRPTSLPLKPGTFVPKRQQSTPVLSLVSPETPRPRKSYGQLYLNGHAYTYLGLKCSTRMFFCTLNKPQPIYVPLSPEHNKVSMYSNWKVCTEADPNPCGLDPGRAMALYDSRHRPNTFTLAQIRNSEAVTHSTYWTNRPTQVNKEESTEAVPKRVKIFAGGFESNEDYIYVRGRGRGRYVCEECGIRCKKPSMLKKHIRTHTDVRPFTCIQCKFSFKTKGNLTKHMKSKAHYKKCVNMGIDPVPTVVDDANVDEEALARQQALRETQGVEAAESEEEDEEDEDETEDEDDDDEDEGYCVEQEAARSLLSLSVTLQSAAQRQQVCAGLVAVSARPNTYPYSFTHCSGPATEPQTPTLTAMSAQREREKVSQNTIMAREVQQHSTKDEAVSSSDQGHYYFPPNRGLADSPQESGEAKQSTPIDLSQKLPEKSPRVCETAMLLASICSTMERLPITTTAPSVSEDSALLQAYLTERAMQDSRIKQQQYKPKAHSTEVPPESEKPSVSKMNISAAKENALGILAQTTSDAHKAPNLSSEQEPVICSKQSTTSPTKPQAEFLPPSSGPSSRYVSILEDGRSMCNICNKVFSKPSQLRLHVNIHYFERPFRCEACAVSFRTSGHLQKHTRSVSHLNKVNMNSTFGTATTTNPRPFKCDDCKIAFRIHGHLAKHLRSKMHIMKLECLGKLPFGTYAELERSGINMNDIDTTDCENSLESLQLLAQKLYEKDPSKLGQWDPAEMMPHHNLSSGDTSSEGEEDEVPLPTDHPPAISHPLHHYSPRSPGSPDPPRTKTEPPSDRRTSVANHC